MVDLKSRRLEIDALRVLCAVQQHGGITRAAEALGITQSAVSHKVRRLEEALDCPLMTRRAGGPMFTAAGRDLLDYADRILGLHDEALLSLTRKNLTGRILLGLTEDTALSDVARILARFRRLHPHVAVRTKVRMSLTLRTLLEQGELDLAILQVFDHEVRPTDTVLLREALHWVRAPDLALPDSGPLPFLSFDDACFYRQWAMDIGQDEGALLEIVFECSSAAGIATAVEAGMGIALLNARHLRPSMEIVDTRLPAPPNLSYILRRSRRAHDLALDSIAAAIIAEVTRMGGLALAG